MNTETPFTFKGEFNEEFLFVDPLLISGRPGKISGPVLLAEEIKEYITKYGLLIANDFYTKNLKGASYSMRPDPSFKAWRFDEKRSKITLTKAKDKDGREYYEVPENSLVYIRLLQKIRLPYYIIGRFNLKVSYAYKGLLLGTGPQVDPGYEAHLNIPLHNFTTNPISIYTDESFVSIDFVRTSSLFIENEVPKSRNELLTNPKYKELHDRLCPQDSKKIARMEIEDYVEDYRPTSSLALYVSRLEATEKKSTEAQKKLDENIEKGETKINQVTTKAEDAISKIERFRIIEIIALLVLLISWWGSLIYIDSRMESRSHVLVGEIKSIPAIEKRIEKLEEMIKEGVKVPSGSVQRAPNSGPSPDSQAKEKSEKVKTKSKDQQIKNKRLGEKGQ